MSRGVAFIALCVVSAVVATATGVYVGRRRRLAHGAAVYQLILFAQAVWAAGAVGELTSTTLSAKIFWDDVQLAPLYVVVFGLVAFALQYTGRRFPGGRLTFGLLAALPTLACVWVFTDPLHHLARTSAHIVDEPPFGALLYDFSTIENLSWFECYALLIVAGVLMVRYSLLQHSYFRAQVAAVTIGAVFPMIGGVFTLSGIRILGQRDNAPLTFGIAGLLVTWGLFRSRLFDLTPIARDTVFEHLPDAAVVLDDMGRVVDLNPAARALAGVTNVSDVLGRSLVELVPATERARFSLSAPPQELEIEVGDVVRTFDARVRPLEGPNRLVQGSVLLLRDITQERLARDALRDAHHDLDERVTERTKQLSEANATLLEQIASRQAADERALANERKLRAVFEQTFQFMGILDLDGRLIAANRTALDFARVSADEVIGRPFWETAWWSHSSDLQARVRSAVAEAARGELVRFEATHPGPDGNLHYIDFSLKGAKDDAGTLTFLIPEGRDISSEKVAEAARVKLAEELAHVQRLDSIGRLAGGIAHDFNNLLSVILGNAEALVAELGEGHSSAEPLRDVLDAAESASGLTRQLLAFSRKQVIERRALDVGAVMNDVRKLLVRIVGEDVELRVDVAPDLWRASADRSQLEQVLVNLAVNGRDAMPRGGLLTLEARNAHVEASAGAAGPGRRAGDFVALVVRDDGVGMTATELERIFDPFYTTKPLGRGTGLGLAVAWGIVEQHEGFIEVESEPGRGSAFRVYLPRAVELRAEVARPVTEPSPRGTEVVAVVEDQLALRHLATRVLTRLGYEVLAFANAAEAVATLEKRDGPLGLLVTDVVLPGENGRELAEKKSSRSAPVCLSSSSPDTPATSSSGTASTRTPSASSPSRSRRRRSRVPCGPRSTLLRELRLEAREGVRLGAVRDDDARLLVLLGHHASGVVHLAQDAPGGRTG